MSIDAWFEDLLPSKWSRRLAVATIAASVGAFGLPSLLPASYLPVAPEHQFLLRVLLLLSAGLAGAFAVLLSIQSHIDTLTEKPSKAVPRNMTAKFAVSIVFAVLLLAGPVNYRSSTADMALPIAIALLASALSVTLLVLFYAVRSAKKMESKAKRSFWESEC